MILRPEEVVELKKKYIKEDWIVNKDILNLIDTISYLAEQLQKMNKLNIK